MGFVDRMAAWLGLTREAAPTVLLPPTRTTSAPISNQGAMAVGSVFRSLELLSTSASQLTIDVRRGSSPVDRIPSLVRRPCQDIRLDEWLAQVVLDLAVDGNAYLLKRRAGGEVLDLPILPADAVHIAKDDRGRITYHHGQDEHPAADIVHLSLLRRAGWLKGVSPLEAARRGLSFSSAASDYASSWFTGSGQPAGILSSDQALTRAQAEEYRDIWNDIGADGNPIGRTANPSGIKVLGKGLHYDPVLLKPADVLWLEAQDFTTVDVARIYGIPSTLMLVGVEGASTTYANVSQEWLAFTRFTLMSYLRPIEGALTDILPRGLDARFNLDGLLRPDTASRYEAHAIALSAGWLDVDEVRAIEGLPPRAPAPPALPAPAPETEAAQ